MQTAQLAKETDPETEAATQKQVECRNEEGEAHFLLCLSRLPKTVQVGDYKHNVSGTHTSTSKIFISYTTARLSENGQEN